VVAIVGTVKGSGWIADVTGLEITEGKAPIGLPVIWVAVGIYKEGVGGSYCPTKGVIGEGRSAGSLLVDPKGIVNGRGGVVLDADGFGVLTLAPRMDDGESESSASMRAILDNRA